MAKSNLVKLQEAIAAGDLELAKTLANKIKGAEAKKKTAKKPAIKRSLSRPKEEPPVEDDWMATTQKPETRVDADGQVHQIARRQSMQGMQHKNTFVDSGEGGLDKKLKAAEQRLAKQPARARPGTSGAAREPAKKIKMRCEGCDRECQIYASEVQATFDENGRPYRFHKCDRCISRRR